MVNGITTTHVHGSNRIFEQDVFSADPEYELISPRTELCLGTSISTLRRLTTQTYPYAVLEKMICGQVYISSVLHLGKLDLKVAASFAIENFIEKNRATAINTEPGDPPYRLTDHYSLKNEYATASQAAFHLGLRCHLNYGIYAKVEGSYTHGFNLQYTDGSNRWSEAVKLGHTFWKQ